MPFLLSVFLAFLSIVIRMASRLILKIVLTVEKRSPIPSPSNYSMASARAFLNAIGLDLKVIRSVIVS
jgi:hypothetical protein